MSKKDVAWLFAVILLAGALVLSLILGMTGYFSSAVYLKSQTDLVVGDTVTISLEPNQASIVSLSFDGAYFPNEQIPQIIQLSAVTCDVDLKVRVKSIVTGCDKTFSFVTSDHFSLSDDYYVYDDLLEHGTKATFCTAIVTPENCEFVSGEQYILTIVVETLEENFASEIWGI